MFSIWARQLTQNERAKLSYSPPPMSSDLLSADPANQPSVPPAPDAWGLAERVQRRHRSAMTRPPNGSALSPRAKARPIQPQI